jgi:hypothetical protein
VPVPTPTAEVLDSNEQNKLGVAYLKGDGVQKDAARAVEWFRKAAEQGNPKAQNNLGVAYLNGTGVSRDAVKAVEWFRKAAEQGSRDAQYNLGVQYGYGTGVSKDAAKAVEWYRKAAEQGDRDAQRSLGVMFRDGNGIARDSAKGTEWLQKAAKQGDASAREELRRFDDVWTDPSTGLMWARRDNGVSTDWNDARRFCRGYRGGGFEDWRLPTITELRTVADGKDIKSPLTLTNRLIWTSDQGPSSSSRQFYNFFKGIADFGPLSDETSHRAFCVRRDH